MKHTVHTPEFWEQVKECYNFIRSDFICISSHIFNDVCKTRESRVLIKDLAHIFLNSNRHLNKRFFVNEGFIDNCVSLFIPNLSYVPHHRAVRIDFINFCIEHTKNIIANEHTYTQSQPSESEVSDVIKGKASHHDKLKRKI